VLGAVGAGVPVGSEAFVDVTALADVLAGTAVLVVGVVVGAAAPPQPAARRTITHAASSDTRTARFTTEEWLILFIITPSAAQFPTKPRQGLARLRSNKAARSDGWAQ
jgi:hypothetical protein